MTTARKIRTFRIKRGMTQKQLGDLCGMADSVIRRYEADKMHISMGFAVDSAYKAIDSGME